MKTFIIMLIRAYQRILSPDTGVMRYFSGGRPACMFYPTCSSYALEAIERHGVFAGSSMAVARVARCHPWQVPSLDPVK
ncbi:membrane protein insertion efficiency factor YidD [Candidatus Parcubacteria bacterium]|nr:membrane protein insertion efficiency factor YidD [Candidatus Parcubacteria bacterium]